MDYPYRKFFLFIPCMLLIFSCALPNFAALAPAPAPTNPAPIRPSASQVPATAQTVNNGQDVQSAGSTVTIEPPDSPDPIVELPTLAVAATDNDSADQTQFDIGVPYQLSRSAVFFHKPPAGQSLVYSLSGGSQLEFSSEPTGQVGELIVVETEDSTYYLIPFSTDAQLKLDVTVPEGSLAEIKANFLFEQPEDQLTWTTSVPENEVTRAEFDATGQRPFLVELRPAPGFDGVLEIYNAEGLLLSKDDNGAGENEFAIFTPSETSRLTFVISGYQAAGGDFELSVTQFPE